MEHSGNRQRKYSMNSRFKAWRHSLAWTLPMVALLAGCTGGDNNKPKTHALATYSSATWEALPAVSDNDLSPVSAPGAAPATDSRLTRSGARPAQRRPTCRRPPARFAVFSSRTLMSTACAPPTTTNGLITGYYEPVYPGSLTQTATANMPVYGVPEDMIIVALDSIYPELKGKRLRGRLEGRVLKPYDDAATIESKGVKAPVVAWLTDPMNLQFLQIQGSGASSSTVAVSCASPMPIRTATHIGPSVAGWSSKAS
jgi:membrane-bound lytic murein transglycosylase A